MKITKQNLANGAILFSLQGAGGDYIECNVKDGVAKLIENLKFDIDDTMPDDEIPSDPDGFNAALDGFFCFLTALAAKGHDLTLFEEEITAALDAIGNEYGE